MIMKKTILPEHIRSSNRDNLTKNLLLLFSATTTGTTTSTTASPSCAAPCRCAGIASYTQWQVFSNDSLFMTINTTNCYFTRTPIYFTSLAGTSSHWSMTSYMAIHAPTNTSFTIQLRGLGTVSASLVMNYSTSYFWNVNWAGVYS